MNHYEAILSTVNHCDFCYPWAYMTDEELERVGMDSDTLPKPPSKTWEIKHPWLVVRCEGCRRVLAEFDAAPRQEEAIWY